MSSDRHLQLHVSIQKGASMPPLRKCVNCCTPAKFHCPFCLPSSFKPTKYSRIVQHLQHHLKRATYFGEYTFHRCALDCRRQTHFHCLYCTAMLLRKRDFSVHLPCCQQAQKGKGQKLSLQIEGTHTPAEADFISYDIKSYDEDDVTILSDSDDQHSQEVNPIIECRTAVRKPPKCDPPVQMNIEKPQDCDEYYFMSLVKVFKKLNPQKKAEVRMKIERLLFEAEFE